MLVFHSLADGTRRAIIELLARQGPTASSAIAAYFTASPAAISQHLKQLHEAGLITREVRGQQRIYRLQPEGLAEIERWIARTRWFYEQRASE